MPESYEHRPHAALRGLVESAVGYRITGEPAGVHLGLPSSMITVIIPLDEPLALEQPGSASANPTSSAAAFDTVLAGLHTGPARIHHDGRQFGIQLGLAPPAARALLGIPAGEVAERAVLLTDILGDAADVVDRLRTATDWSTRFAVLDDALLARRFDRRRSSVAPELVHAWSLCRQRQTGRHPVASEAGIAVPRISEAGISLPAASTSVADIAAAIGWSTRNLQKRFRAEFGVTPGDVARVDRFQRSMRLVSDPHIPLAEVAVDAGYSDQAHLTRAWQRFAGLPPARWRATETLVAGLTESR